MNLIETLRKPEGKTLEFKRDLSSPDRFLRTVVAFANTSGGTILIGVEDRSGHIRGVTNPLELEERAANLISDSIRPRLLPDLEIASYRNTQLLAVRVYPSPARPHFIRREGLGHGAYVRLGSTNRQYDLSGRPERRVVNGNSLRGSNSLDLDRAFQMTGPCKIEGHLHAEPRFGGGAECLR